MKPEQSGSGAKSGPPKVFDVMRPGKAQANPSARPIIVGHKPQVHDTVSGVSGLGERSPQTKKKIELSPLSHAATEKSVPLASEHLAASEQPKIPEAEHAAPKPEPAMTAPEPTPKPEATPEAKPPAPSEIAAEPTKPKSETHAKPHDAMVPVFDTPPEKSPEGLPPAADVAPVFDDTPAPIPDRHEIIVSHHGILDEPVKIIGLLLLIIVLAAVAVNILIDADVLELDGIPHTNFF